MLSRQIFRAGFVVNSSVMTTNFSAKPAPTNSKKTVGQKALPPPKGETLLVFKNLQILLLPTQKVVGQSLTLLLVWQR